VGDKAYTRIKKIEKTLSEAAGMLKCEPEAVPGEIKRLQDEVETLNEEIKRSNKEKISSKIADILKTKKEINGLNLLVFVFKGVDSSDLVFISDTIKKELGSVFIFLVSETQGKNIFICSTTEDYAKRQIETNKFVSLFKEELTLKGGGRPALVQGVITGTLEKLPLRVENCFIKFIQK
jgi:alanyl-tRNA synthetase